MQIRDELEQRLKMLAAERREILTEAALSALEGILSAGGASCSEPDRLVKEAWDIAEAFAREWDVRVKNGLAAAHGLARKGGAG